MQRLLINSNFIIFAIIKLYYKFYEFEELNYFLLNHFRIVKNQKFWSSILVNMMKRHC
jgi:hypothetical protein